MTVTTHSSPTLSSGCRLVTTDGRLLPLRSVNVAADAGGGLARVRLRQTFVNPWLEPLAVTYLLPLPADGAVVDFAFVLGGAADRRSGRTQGRRPGGVRAGGDRGPHRCPPRAGPVEPVHPGAREPAAGGGARGRDRRGAAARLGRRRVGVALADGGRSAVPRERRGDAGRGAGHGQRGGQPGSRCGARRRWWCRTR